MLKLPSGMEITISINDEELPLNQFACPAIQIDGSEEFGIPILNMALVDNTGGIVLRTFTPIGDGSLISIRFVYSGNSITREFRATASMVEGARLLIRGYLNHPKYIVTTTKSVLNMTSKEALSHIAEECGMEFEGVATADKMRWQPANLRYINFARNILSASYASDNSMIVGRIRLDGLMKTIDLSDLQSLKSKAILGYGNGALPLYGMQPSTRATPNIHGGYKQVIAVPDMFGGVKTIDSLDFATEETSLNRNPKMAKLNDNGSIGYSVISHPSNLHENYYRAIYNNNRVNKLYTLGLTVALNSIMTNLDALDVVTVDATNPTEGSADGKHAVNFNGDWGISCKSIFVENAQYFERFTLMRAGLSIDMHSNTI